jgi:hypothetical protein
VYKKVHLAEKEDKYKGNNKCGFYVLKEKTKWEK